MTWIVVRLLLSLAFVGGLLLLASRLAKKRGLGGGADVIEVVARQRMGRASSVTVLRVAGRVLVVGATDAQVTLLAEVEDDELATALAGSATARQVTAADVHDEDAELPVDGDAEPTAAFPSPRATPRATPALRPVPPSSGALAGSVLDRGTWTTVVQELREKTVRR